MKYYFIKSDIVRETLVCHMKFLVGPVLERHAACHNSSNMQHFSS